MRVLENIFTVNLGIRKEEKVLVLTDLIRPDEVLSKDESARRMSLRKIAGEAAQAGRLLCDVSYLEYPAPSNHGMEPPVEIWRAAFGDGAVELLKREGLLEKILIKKLAPEDLKSAETIIKERAKSPDCVIALSNFSTSHTRFRDFLTRLMGVRYASMPLFEESMLRGAMKADWKEVRERTHRLARKISGADTVVITSHNGTSISFSISGREVKADTGILTERGAFGNLPAGEAFTAPVEGTAEGTLILEWGPTRRLRKSVTLEVKGGRVVEVSDGDEFASSLREKITLNPLCGNIAELGIGTNEKASRPDNILETEKILGTVHIALGDNSSFGGKVSVPFHQDFIFFKPTMEVIKDNEKIEILIEGEPRF